MEQSLCKVQATACGVLLLIMVEPVLTTMLTIYSIHPWSPLHSMLILLCVPTRRQEGPAAVFPEGSQIRFFGCLPMSMRSPLVEV